MRGHGSGCQRRARVCQGAAAGVAGQRAEQGYDARNKRRVEQDARAALQQRDGGQGRTGTHSSAVEATRHTHKAEERQPQEGRGAQQEREPVSRGGGRPTEARTKGEACKR